MLYERQMKYRITKHYIGKRAISFLGDIEANSESEALSLIKEKFPAVVINGNVRFTATALPLEKIKE